MNERANHDEYGKRLLSLILGNRWVSRLEDNRSTEMGGVRADLDGLILSEDLSRVECVVEIEGRTYKQIRGGILDLAWHPAPRKMLVIILAQPQLGNDKKARAHCMFVWEKLTKGENVPFELVVLRGTGAYPMEEADRPLLTEALKRLSLLR